MVIETPQQFFLRIACALSENVSEALELYRLFSTLEYLPSSPTMFNAGTRHEQLSSCFLLDSPEDHLAGIYQKYADAAMLSKFSGGIGLAYHRVRSRGSLIESTNGHSNGIVPWLKTLDASVAAVNQGGKRKGACCVYLEPWHADIEDFLAMRENTGDDASRTHNLNLANWIPDLFMKRVEADADWSLFDPKVVPTFPDLYGDEFERAYLGAEEAGLAAKTVKARELYARMMRSLAQTGNGWMTFKDKSNRACNQTALPGRTVHLSNLCTEIIEVTSGEETAVCNLGSINLGRHLARSADGKLSFDFEKLGRTVRTAVRQLDQVIGLNYYPIPSTQASNLRWRPVGLGVMGLQDVFFQMRLAFDAPEARALSKQVAEEIYFHALSASADLAVEKGQHPSFPETRAANGELQFDAWGVTPTDTTRWRDLLTDLRNPNIHYLDYFTGEFDHVAHLASDRLAQLHVIDSIDALVGRIWSAIAANPSGDKTALVMVSDHGMNTADGIYSQGYSLIDWFNSAAGGAHHVLTNRHPMTEFKLKGLDPLVSEVISPSAETTYLAGEANRYPTAVMDLDGNERANISLRNNSLNQIHILLAQLVHKRLTGPVRHAVLDALFKILERERPVWRRNLHELDDELGVLRTRIDTEQKLAGIAAQRAKTTKCATNTGVRRAALKPGNRSRGNTPSSWPR